MMRSQCRTGSTCPISTINSLSTLHSFFIHSLRPQFFREKCAGRKGISNKKSKKRRKDILPRDAVHRNRQKIPRDGLEISHHTLRPMLFWGGQGRLNQPRGCGESILRQGDRVSICLVELMFGPERTPVFHSFSYWIE